MTFTFTDEQTDNLSNLRDQAEAGSISWASVYDQIYSYISVAGARGRK